MDNNQQSDAFDPQQFQQALTNQQSDGFNPQEYQKYTATQNTPGVDQSFPGGVIAPQASTVPNYNKPGASFMDIMSAGSPAAATNPTPEQQQQDTQQQQVWQQEWNKQQDVANQTEKALGAKYDPNALSDIERTKLGSAQENGDIDSEVKSMFPTGTISHVQGTDGTDYVKIQKDYKEDPFLLSPGSVKAWSEWYNIGNNPDLSPLERANTFANAVSHWTEDNPKASSKIALETLLTGEGGLMANTGRLVAGDAGANLAWNKGSLSTSTTDTMVDGAMIMAGYGAGATANAAVALARGRGILMKSKEGIQMLRDADQLKQLGSQQGLSENELNNLTPMPNQVTNNKLVQLQTGIASRMIDTLSHYVDNQRTLASKIFRGQYDSGDVEGLMKPVTGEDTFSSTRSGTLPDAVDALKAGKATPITAPSTNSLDAASGINNDFGSYAARSKGKVDDLYNQARSIEEPQFDIRPAINTAEDLEKGIKTSQGTQLHSLSPDLQNIVSKVKAFNNEPLLGYTDAEGKSTSAMDQLNTLRSQLYPLTQEGSDAAGRVRTDTAEAKKLYGSLTDVLNNTTNITPGFQKAWKIASDAASQRFGYLDDPLLRRGFKQDEGDILSPGSTSANTLGGQTENLQKLQGMVKDGVISQNSYDALIDSQKRKLFADPATLSDKLSALQKQKPELLNQLFSDPAELQDYKNFGDAYKNLGKTNIEGAMGDTSNAYALVDRLFNSGTKDLTTAQLDYLAKATPNSPMGKQLRAAALDHIWAQATNTDRGTLKLSSSGLDTQVRNAQSQGGYLTRLLTPEDTKALDMFLRYSQGVDKNVGSLGSSFAAYSEASKLREFEHEAIMKLVESAGFGKFVTSNLGQKVLYGSTDFEHQPGLLLKKLGAAAGTAMSPTNNRKVDNADGQ